MHFVLKILPNALAVLCLVALVPWALGVPGTDNDYARGWSIGFYAIVWYLAAFAVLLALGLAARFGWLPIPQDWLDYLRLAAALAFVVAQIIAWPLILG